MRLDASRLAAVEPDDLPELTAFLGLVDLTVSGLDSPQVRLFRRPGQLGREVSWSRPSSADSRTDPSRSRCP